MFIANRDEATREQTISKTVLTGNSGIGKSTFLTYLMTILVKEAREKNVAISIQYTAMSKAKQPRSYLLRSDGTASVIEANAQVDYDFSDSFDIPSVDHVLQAAIIVASEKSSEYERFLKEDAIVEVLFPVFPVWKVEELEKLPHSRTMSDTEKNLRFGIFGGNPRHFFGRIVSNRETESYSFVGDLMSAYFSEEKLRLSIVVWDKIRQYLVHKLANAANHFGDVSSSTVKSLMWHTNNSLDFFWGSKFLEFLGSQILELRESSIRALLVRVIGHSGFGNMFEYRGHMSLSNPLPGTGLYLLHGLGRGNSNRRIQFRQLNKKRFRTIEDIRDLNPGEYGLPYASNFPLVDAVIQPNILIQFTIATKHRAATHKLSDIRDCLQERDKSKHLMIFVVEDTKKFSEQADLGDIKQFAMSYVVVGEKISAKLALVEV